MAVRRLTGDEATLLRTVAAAEPALRDQVILAAAGDAPPRPRRLELVGLLGDLEARGLVVSVVAASRCTSDRVALTPAGRRALDGARGR